MLDTEDRGNRADTKAAVTVGLEVAPTHEPGLFKMLEAACASAIQKWINVTDLSPRRFLSPRESARYLSLSEREVYRMVSSRELPGVKHGRRLMIDVEDLLRWIVKHKAG